MSRAGYIAGLLAALVVMLSGCQGHEYYNYEDLVAGGGKLRIEFEWNGYTDIPPGMNLVFYPADGAGVPIMHQLQYDGGNVSLPAGRYDAVVYNDYTYNIYYRGMEAFATAEAYLQDYDRLPLAARAPVLRNVAEPDVFYVTQIRNLSVSSADGDRIILVYPQLKTLKLFIHVEVEGIHNVSQADGSITGAAGNVMLATGLSSGADAACKRLFPLSLSDEGLYAETSMFLGNRPLEADYVLELAFLLRNLTDQILLFFIQIGQMDRRHKGQPSIIHLFLKLRNQMIQAHQSGDRTS